MDREIETPIDDDPTAEIEETLRQLAAFLNDPVALLERALDLMFPARGVHSPTSVPD